MFPSLYRLAALLSFMASALPALCLAWKWHPLAFILAALAGGLITGGGFWLFLGPRATALAEAAGAMEAIARGDLRYRTFRYARRDELGQIMENISKMLKGYNKHISQIHFNMRALEEGAAQVNSGMEQVTASSQAQAEQVGGLLKEMEVMAAQFAGVSAKTSEVLEVVSLTFEAAEKGAGTIGRFARQMDGLTAKMAGLKERAGTVTRTVQVTAHVARQTGLLALNASIEAARAKGGGRGFAVVAQQIGKLAQNSAHSGQQIGELLAEIAAGTSRAEEAVRRGADLVKQAGELLEAINAAVSRCRSAIEEINRRAQEQASSARTITQAAEAVAAFSQQAAATACQSFSHLAELARLTRKLREVESVYQSWGSNLQGQA
ncbi:methyl-accepting chemotaxis protein [Desulfovirgula thermocuniculi]|uniref:methyl-accepting chemotaxis protein n=1 Tax=Desulfovirgula thermocuniculi TaxID=348842 RepID=UPI0003FC78AF|nr:methyl-accepting chemotaxis protein [Desulfovirgula thermocuniculi]